MDLISGEYCELQFLATGTKSRRMQEIWLLYVAQIVPWMKIYVHGIYFVIFKIQGEKMQGKLRNLFTQSYSLNFKGNISVYLNVINLIFTWGADSICGPTLPLFTLICWSEPEIFLSIYKSFHPLK